MRARVGWVRRAWGGGSAGSYRDVCLVDLAAFSLCRAEDLLMVTSVVIVHRKAHDKTPPELWKPLSHEVTGFLCMPGAQEGTGN